MYRKQNFITLLLIIASVALLAACGSDTNTVYVPITETPSDNTAPIANAGANTLVPPGDMAMLNASASSDGEDDSLTYSWSFISMPEGSSAALSNSTIADPTFTPDIDGDYVLALIVNDGLDNSAVDYVTVTLGLPSELVGADLSGLDLTGMNLALANLAGADLSGASLVNAVLYQADLALANLTGAYLQNAYIQNANLSGAYLTYANLSGAYLQNANLTYADLQNANLTFAYLLNANLTFAYLQTTNLTFACFLNADLTSANFTGADLTGANLSGANLTEANLSGANLTEANLSGADLSAAGLTSAVLTGVIWSDTTCPDGTNTDSNSDGTCVGHLTL